METEDTLRCWLKSPETLLEHRVVCHRVGVDSGAKGRVDPRGSEVPQDELESG